MPTHLLAFIASISQWRSCTFSPEDNCVVVKMKSGAVQRLNALEANEVDARLWSALCVLTSLELSAMLVPVNLDLTVKNWMGLFPEYGSNTPAQRFVVTNFNSVEGDLPDTAELAVTMGLAEVTSYDNVDVVVCRRYATLPVSYSWLDTMFPGSVGRVRSAVDIGLSKQEQAHHMVHGVQTFVAESYIPDDFLLAA